MSLVLSRRELPGRGAARAPWKRCVDGKGLALHFGVVVRLQGEVPLDDL